MQYRTEGPLLGSSHAAPTLRQQAAEIRRLAEEAQQRYEAGLIKLAVLEARLLNLQRRLP